MIISQNMQIHINHDLKTPKSIEKLDKIIILNTRSMHLSIYQSINQSHVHQSPDIFRKIQNKVKICKKKKRTLWSRETAEGGDWGRDSRRFLSKLSSRLALRISTMSSSLRRRPPTPSTTALYPLLRTDVVVVVVQLVPPPLILFWSPDFRRFGWLKIEIKIFQEKQRERPHAIYERGK